MRKLLSINNDEPSWPVISITRNFIFSFADDNVVFQCRYSRSISVDEGLVVVSPTQPEVGTGDLTYSMIIAAGALGGTTNVEITPNHSFGDEVGARLVL